MTYSAADIAEVIEKLASAGRKRLTANDVWDEIGHHQTLDHPNATMGGGSGSPPTVGLLPKPASTRSHLTLVARRVRSRYGKRSDP